MQKKREARNTSSDIWDIQQREAAGVITKREATNRIQIMVHISQKRQQDQKSDYQKGEEKVQNSDDSKEQRIPRRFSIGPQTGDSDSN